MPSPITGLRLNSFMASPIYTKRCTTLPSERRVWMRPAMASGSNLYFSFSSPDAAPS